MDVAKSKWTDFLTLIEAADRPQGKREYFDSIDKLKEIILTKNYSPFEFENDYKHGDKWNRTNCSLIYDIDQTLTLEQAERALQKSGFKYLIFS